MPFDRSHGTIGRRSGDAGAHRLDAVYDAVLFDLDVVVEDAATVEPAAGKELADEIAADGTVAGPVARESELLAERVRARGPRVHPGAAALLRRLRDAAVPVGLVTANRGAQPLLEAAGLTDGFDAVVDGEIALTDHLAGKPDPAMFEEAARRLGVAAGRTAIVDDSVAGVRAGRRGGFGLVVGIDRGGQRAQLEAAGADVVFANVAQLDLGVSRKDPWRLVYDGFDPAHEGHREALTALGNGYLVTRGARPEHRDDGIHYPGTYLAGVYNRLTSTIHGRTLEEEHLVNTPNWLPVDLRIGDGPWLSTGRVVAHGERRELDLRGGLLTRRMILTGPRGQRLEFVQRSFASMDDPHLAALETTITALDSSSTLGLRSGIDAGVRNTNVPAYVGSDTTHLERRAFREVGDIVVCEAQTRQSQVRIATAVRERLTGAGSVSARRGRALSQHIREFRIRVEQGRPVTLTKIAAIVTSRDRAITEPGTAAINMLVEQSGDIASLVARHEAVWRRMWDRFAVALDADAQSRLVLNLHIFHLLQTLSPHTAELDAGVPARGLHGEGYRGHVFWDEVFVLPALAVRLPEVSRSLLDYRWRRLRAARAAAAAAGLAGAMFPWQSGSDGREETPAALYNPRSGRWMPDNSYRQRHIGLAVAYNAWQHYQATGDLDWLAQRGGELIIEVTRLFASLADYDAATDRFHTSGVMGPDEFHDGPPDAPGTGLHDNTYTNVLASWVALRAGESLQLLNGHRAERLRDRLQITDMEVAGWAHLGRRLAVGFHRDGILTQFDGYEELQELDWDRYRDQYRDIGRLDLILESENDSTNRYKLAKQPDVVMLVYLLGHDGLRTQLAALGYPFSEADLVRTVEYYLARTSNGSTLGRVVNASVLAGIDRTRSWVTFREALIADLDDSQGGTTREGIHLGAMAGSADLPVRSFAGMALGDDELVFTPRLPPHVTRVAFQVLYRGQLLDVTLDQKSLQVRARPGTAPAIRLRVGAVTVQMSAGQTMVFPTAQTDAGTVAARNVSQ